MAVSKSELFLEPCADATTQVLIIDDSPSDRDYYSRCLREQGVIVTAAASGEEGIEKLQSLPIDCVLLDYYLPSENGIDVLNTMSGCAANDDLPIIMMTGAGSEDVAVSAWKSGAADYLSKEKITPEALRRAVANVVEKSRLRRKVAEHAEDLEHANAALKKRNDEVRQFYLTISHELNTPLAAARECVSLVCDGIHGELNDDQREYLEDATESHDQLAAHLKDLIESTRLANGKLKVVPKPIQIDDVVRRSFASNAVLARERDVQIETQIPDDLPAVLGDKNRLVQVLCNLISNAIKHSNSSHSIVVAADLDGDRVTVSVADKGCGIDSEHHTGIFERLFQIPGAAEKNGGLGLGLSIAQEIIRQHGSCITVQSEINSGSNFSFQLNVADR